MGYDELRTDGTEVDTTREKIMIFDQEKVMAYLYAGWNIHKRVDSKALWLEREGRSSGLNIGWNVLNDFLRLGFLEEHAQYPRGHYLMSYWTLNDNGKQAYERMYKNKHDELKAGVADDESKLPAPPAVADPKWYTMLKLSDSQVILTFLVPDGFIRMITKLNDIGQGDPGSTEQAATAPALPAINEQICDFCKKTYYVERRYNARAGKIAFHCCGAKRCKADYSKAVKNRAVQEAAKKLIEDGYGK